MREVHSTERIRCPLITCHFVAKRLALVREHWQKKHPNLEFPEMRQRSGFGYSFATKENVSFVGLTEHSFLYVLKIHFVCSQNL